MIKNAKKAININRLTHAVAIIIYLFVEENATFVENHVYIKIMYRFEIDKIKRKSQKKCNFLQFLTGFK